MTMTEQTAFRHWSETEQASHIRTVFRQLAPAFWDVFITTPQGAVLEGEIERANAHGLIARILEVSDHLRANQRLGVSFTNEVAS